MSFGLMVLLIAMVINVGFLVATKINLQNSVDMAAYAGAAQQARYLTELGKWNYEMRRNYKAFVFDYLLTYSAEMASSNDTATDEFKMYVTNTDANGNTMTIRTPWVCASLQGGSGDPTSSQASWKQMCQKMKGHTFQNAVSTMLGSIAGLEAAQASICTINPSSTSCQAIWTSYYNSLGNLADLQSAQGMDLQDFYNYKDGDMLNYNLRLLAWTLHDYRHLQSRIRGVHYGDITIGKLNSNREAEGTGRWSLTKANANQLTVFENSPMSIAAKVINGFSNATDTNTKLESNKANLLEEDLLKNPINDAALTTFKNNLLTAISDGAKLYHITPQNFNAAPLGTTGNQDMGGGCAGQCNEFTGPYLKANRHDVGFKGLYVAVEVTGTDVGTPIVATKIKNIGNFPVGIAKDNRVLTYYAVVGTARTDQIPFNIFFGNDQDSNPDVPMVAVAVARPFGSRVGPYIDQNCPDLYDSSNQDNCIKNGSDPLYPFKQASDTNLSDIPNFSIVEQADPRRLGVKMSVSRDEFKLTNKVFPSSTSLSEFFAKTRTKLGRNRFFRFKRPIPPTDTSFAWDDGFSESSASDESSGPKISNTKFFDNDNTAIHPQGNRNSVWAWDGTVDYADPTSNATVPRAKRDNYEGYLEKTQTNNLLQIYKFASLPGRMSGNSAYNVYVFKYPAPSGNSPENWDIQGLATGRPDGALMENAFANTMAVSTFETKRYILPSRGPNTTSGLSDDVLNYNAGNPDAMIYDGTTTQKTTGQGNKKFAEIVTGKEPTDILGSSPFSDSYTSWRIGSRGYRVKLINMQDVVGSNCTYENCLSSSYTIDDPDGESITVDLSKVFY